MDRDTNRPRHSRDDRPPPPIDPDELGEHASGSGALGDVPLGDEELREDALGTGLTRDDEPGGDLRPDETRSLYDVAGEDARTDKPIDEALADLDRPPGGLGDLRTDDRRAAPSEHESSRPLSGEPRTIEGTRGEALRDGYELTNEDEDPPAAAPGRLGH